MPPDGIASPPRRRIGASPKAAVQILSVMNGPSYSSDMRPRRSAPPDPADDPCAASYSEATAPRRPPPRVLQMVTRLGLGGAERIAVDLIRGMGEWYEFALYAAKGIDGDAVGRGMRDELAILGVPLHLGTRVPIKYGGMVLAGAWAERAVRRFRPDLIHLHTEIPESAYAAMVALRPGLRRTPVVRTIHNAVYWDSWRALGRWCDGRMGPSFVAGVSQAAVDAFGRLRARSGAGPPPLAPAVIYNGVPLRDAPRPAERPPGTPFRILFAGRFEDQKGVDLLPAIVRRVRVPAGRRLELVLFGAGTHRDLLRALAADPPPGWTIAVRDPVADLHVRFAEYDLVVMPSRYEGLGLVAIEAAFAGVPAVVTDAPGLRETVPRDYAFRAASGDAESFAAHLQRAIDDPDALARAAGHALAHARARFDAAAMCAGYRRLYQSVLDARPAGAAPSHAST